MAKTLLFCFDEVLVATEFAGVTSADTPEKRQLKFNIRERPGLKQAFSMLANAGFAPAVIAQGSPAYVSAVLKAIGLENTPVVAESPEGKITVPLGMEPVGIVGCAHAGRKKADMSEHAAVQIKSIPLPFADYSSVKPMLFSDPPSEPLIKELTWCIERLEKKYHLDRTRLQCAPHQAANLGKTSPAPAVR